MPCENCNVQFTVFRRKRTCGDCKRFYCNNCLTNSKRNAQILLCQRCCIFSKRPLLRTDLLQLKPKDLIFYLQSKHISTTGCVEKDELIRLVLNHVDQNDASGSQQQQQQQRQQQSKQNSPTDSTGNNSFDNLRQTCQNFFFNITENISDSLASFDSKSNKTQQQDNNNVNSNGGNGNSQSTQGDGGDATTTHIFDQPRVTRREIPTYASSLNSGTTTQQQQQPNQAAPTTTILINERFPTSGQQQQQQQPQPSTSTRTRTTTTNISGSQSSSLEEQKTSNSSSLASPIISTSSIASQGRLQENRAAVDETDPHINLNVPKLSDCECSDDELFANYTHTRNSLTTTSPPPPLPPADLPQPHTSQQRNQEQPQATATKALNLKLVPNEGDEVSHSSFEELGATGCLNANGGNSDDDDEKCAEDSGGSSNNEAWQILEPNSINNIAEGTTTTTTTTAATTVIENEPANVVIPPRKKLLRRRSDRQRSSLSDEPNSPTNLTTAATGVDETTTAPTRAHSSTSTADFLTEEVQPRRRSGTCRRCGKSNIRRYVEKMRQHLESAQMSEADIKRELNEFLAYLDEQTRSLDYSETETTASPLPNEATAATSNAQVVLSPTASARNMPFFTDLADDNDGIHVYGAEASPYTMEHDPRFVNLYDYDSVKDLESLTVKQLKEVLMLHRVNYKGCCEKQELLERVERLWKERKTTPAVEKLPTDELCKICMDAPIDCVILECGHMATCTKCGKVLSECPICRQYIVRVVHTFRA